MLSLDMLVSQRMKKLQAAAVSLLIQMSARPLFTGGHGILFLWREHKQREKHTSRGHRWGYMGVRSLPPSPSLIICSLALPAAALPYFQMSAVFAFDSMFKEN